MSPGTHREVRLATRPAGELGPEHFEVVEVPVPEPGPGQVLVRNRTMSVAAVMYTAMRGDVPFPPPIEVGAVPWGQVVGEVVASDGTELALGELVEHRSSWREYAVVDAAEAMRLDLAALPDPAAHLSQGNTAWIGMVRAARVQPGDTVFVSGAAGGVGALAGQIARLRGAKLVIGSTSTQRKADYLRDELGYDAVILRGGDIEDQLRAVAPEGIDVLFDNVGGQQLRVALALARREARFALVGALQGQLDSGAKAPLEIDSFDLVTRGITLRGIAGLDHRDAVGEWVAMFGRGLRDGTLVFPHTRLSGVEQAPRALLELLAGQHIGAVLVDL